LNKATNHMPNQLGAVALAGSSEADEFYAQTQSFYEACALCYEELYPDHVQASKNAAQAVASLFHRYSVSRILDASCGLGHDIENFSKQGFNVDGADISPKMLCLAEARLKALGLSGVRLYLCDVRALKEVIPAESYDAVIFRGNTLSNLEYSDYPLAFSQMAYVLRPNGLLYVDFRDGEVHFREKRRFEFRGFHFNKAARTLSIAWYLYRHGHTLDDTFQVSAKVISLGWSKGLFPRLRMFSLRINSHYVPEPKVFGGLEQAGFKILDKINLNGLPYLQTYIAQKVARIHP
jgi:ubiquinone/menaquinone biosynthesis C-methylase UbiE